MRQGTCIELSCVPDTESVTSAPASLERPAPLSRPSSVGRAQPQSEQRPLTFVSALASTGSLSAATNTMVDSAGGRGGQGQMA